MNALISRFPAMLLVMLFALASPFALADDDDDDDDRQEQTGPVKGSIADKLGRVDGAQALVAAVLLVDEAKVLPFSLVDLLGGKRPKIVLFAPSNAAFENALGLPAGTLNGLTIAEIKAALEGIVAPEDVGDVANTLLKHAVLDIGRASQKRLLKKGKVTAADGTELTVAVGAAGVEINREATIILADFWAKNGIIHFIDTVIGTSGGGSTTE